MTDHDPFGSADDQDPSAPTDDDKTVQYAKNQPAQPAAADDDTTVQYSRPSAPPPIQGDEDKDETVRYSTARPVPSPPPAQSPPPVWHASNEPTLAPQAPPNSPVPPAAQAWQQPAPQSWFPGVPGQGQPPANGNRQRWIIGGSVAAAVVVIAVIVAIVLATSGPDGSTTAATETTSPAMTKVPPTSSPDESTTSEPAPPRTPPASLGPTDLAGLLQSTNDISTTMDSPGMTAGPVSTKLTTGTTVTPPNCTSAWSPIDAVAYAGSGYTGVAAQVVQDLAPINHQVNQAIVSFPDDQAAKASYDKQVAAWKSCHYVKFTAEGAENSRGTTGVSAETDGTTNMLVVVDARAGGGAVQCQRSITARKNVIVDVRACSPSVGSAGWTIARDIGEKITGQR